jgi:hypothetical protein
MLDMNLGLKLISLGCLNEKESCKIGSIRD